MTNITEWTGYCLSCPRPRCETGCPTGNHIRDFIKALKENNLEAAGNILYAVNPYPELTSRLCDCARQCQGSCVRGIRQEPVRIQQIERYISDNTTHRIIPGPAVAKKVALVGAGPANLAAAVDFLSAGYHVDIYEKLDAIGGAIYSGIPAYRFDKKHLDNIYRNLQEAGVSFFLNTEIGKDIPLSTLQEKYDAVLVGIGAQIENTYGMDAESGSMGGLSLLYDLNVRRQTDEYARRYKRAVVWGGGNVAMDCARSLVRILEEVFVLYRRSESEMPANTEEIAEAKEEGVKFLFLENAKELQTDENGKVTGVHVVKMELGEKDESGRFSTHEIPDSHYCLPIDLFVAAVGQKVQLQTLNGTLAKTENRLSTLPKVYLSGDAFLGPKTVAAAIHDGRTVAREIISTLS